MAFPIITAAEAAELVKNGDSVAFSGFTAAGTPKFVAPAIAEKAIKEHEAGRPFKINVFTGASTNDYTDGALARANAVEFRTPYQSCKDTRARINNHDINYVDMHLSHLAQDMRYHFFGKIDLAIIEACEVSEKGEIVLGPGVGNIPTFARMADKIVIELNEHIPTAIKGLHDIYMPLDPPYRREIPIYKPSDRIGDPVLKVDPAKIVGIVKTYNTDHVHGFTPIDETTMRIGENVCKFLIGELKAGRIPKEFLPLQSGVGNIANAVLHGLEASPEIPQFDMYTEVIQDAVLDLMEKGKCRFGSTCSLTFSDETMDRFFNNIDFFRDKVLIRPGEISNNPEVIRRLGVISMNTALEADIFGNVNSTHVVGTKMMNGIGGSGDFTRNAYISIPRPQRTLRMRCHYRPRHRRPAWQKPDTTRRSYHRKLRASRLSPAAPRLSENLQRRTHAPHAACRFCFPRRIRQLGRHVENRLLKILLISEAFASGKLRRLHIAAVCPQCKRLLFIEKFTL